MWKAMWKTLFNLVLRATINAFASEVVKATASEDKQGKKHRKAKLAQATAKVTKEQASIQLAKLLDFQGSKDSKTSTQAKS